MYLLISQKARSAHESRRANLATDSDLNNLNIGEAKETIEAEILAKHKRNKLKLKNKATIKDFFFKRPTKKALRTPNKVIILNIKMDSYNSSKYLNSFTGNKLESQKDVATQLKALSL